MDDLRERIKALAVKLTAKVDVPDAIPARQKLVRSLAQDLRQRLPGATERQAAQAIATAIRNRLGEAGWRYGGAPNTHVILSDDELTFIAEHYKGSKSAAIHDGLALLMKRAKSSDNKKRHRSFTD